MALGVVIAVLWWPGLVTAMRTASHRWLAVAWVVTAVIYLDAALDSPLGLSALYYRGQDRLAMPLAMLSAVLVVPGLQCWARLLGRRAAERSAPRLPSAVTAVLVVVAVLAALTSIPARSDNAAKNLAAHYPGRGRFLQADERALFEQHVPRMDPDGTVLASPFSGAAHLYALFGQDVRLPVAGMAYTDLDRDLIYATEDAATDPADCRLLEENGIAYVYQELTPYNLHKTSDSVNLAGPDLGTVLFRTDHSRMIEIDCDPGGGSYDPVCSRPGRGAADPVRRACRSRREALLAAARRGADRRGGRSGHGPRHRGSPGLRLDSRDARAALAAVHRRARLHHDLGGAEPGSGGDARRLDPIPGAAAASPGPRHRGVDRLLRRGDGDPAVRWVPELAPGDPRPADGLVLPAPVFPAADPRPDRHHPRGRRLRGRLRAPGMDLR